MDISSYVLLSHNQALRRRLDVSANNMANISTAGFKREAPVFREYVEQSGRRRGCAGQDDVDGARLWRGA
jgi:flagellar basal-body rod protein FlgF